MSESSDSASSPRPRGVFLTVMAALLAVLAISNLTKPLQHLRQPGHLGLVVFGYRIESFAGNAIFGTIFGLILLAYVWGIWKMKRWVLPLAIVYAFYVPVNLVLFWFSHGAGPHPPLDFILIYLAFALTGSVGTGLYLSYRQAELS
jgi:hypothetical protein